MTNPMRRLGVLAVAAVLLLPLGTLAQTPLRIGVITFLSGPAAGPFGVPARNASDLVADAMNAGGQVPGYEKRGFGGRPIDYLPECLEFKDGKAFANQRPGLGVTMDMTKVKQIGEVTQPGRQNIFRRPDGSLTHW